MEKKILMKFPVKRQTEFELYQFALLTTLLLLKILHMLPTPPKGTKKIPIGEWVSKKRVENNFRNCRKLKNILNVLYFFKWR